MEKNNKLQKMLKGIIKSVKKNRKNNTEHSSQSEDSEKISNASTKLDHEENDKISERRTPLLTWSPSLDNLVKSWKAEKQNHENASVEYAADDDHVLESINFSDDCKMTLRFDSPHFCSRDRENVDFKRLIYHDKKPLDASYHSFENSQDYVNNDQSVEGPIKTLDNILDKKSFSSTFNFDDESTSGNQIREQKHQSNFENFADDDYSRFGNSTISSFTLEYLNNNMSGQSSNNLNKAYYCSTEDCDITSSVHSESFVFDNNSSHPLNDDMTKDPPYGPSHIYDLISPASDHNSWSVVPLEFIHDRRLEPFSLSSDEFDQPFVSIQSSNDILKEGDRFLEINGIVVIQFSKQAVTSLFDKLPIGCLIRAVVLRKHCCRR